MLQDILVIAGMFLLRIGLPLIVLVAMGYLLERWLGYREEERVIIRRAEPAAGEGRVPAGQAVPAWTMMPCASQVSRAYKVLGRSSLPCWLALEQAGGRLLDQCLACQWYHPQIEAREAVKVNRGGQAA